MIKTAYFISTITFKHCLPVFATANNFTHHLYHDVYDYSDNDDYDDDDNKFIVRLMIFKN